MAEQQDERERPFGREDTIAAIIAAAMRLYTERDPSRVSMREIAREAGVTYGLLHRHFGSKQAIVAAVFRNASLYGSDRVLAAPDALAGLLEMVGLAGDPTVASRFATMLAMVVLAGSPPGEYFEHSPAVDVLLERIALDGFPAPSEPLPEDPRVVLVAALLVGLGWHFFGPFMQHALHLDDRDPSELRAELAAIVADLAARHFRADTA